MRIVICVCISLLTATIIVAVLSIAATIDIIPMLLHTEIQDARMAVIGEIADLRAQAAAHVGELTEQVALARQDLNTNTKKIVEVLDARVTDTNSILDKQLADYRVSLEEANAAYVSRLDIALQQTGEIQTRLLEREPLVYSRFLATTGEAMRTMDAIRRVSETAAEAAPRVVKSTEEIAAASALATQNTAALMGNLNTLTKPKPWWQKAFGAVTVLKVLLP